jgi:hypothetical protein
MPPVASSVDPMGMPTRPTVDRVPRAGEEADAVGLEDVDVVPLAQVPEAVPDTPILSNRGVGAIVAPVMTVLAPAIEVPVLEFPGLEEDGWTDAPIPEHVEAVVIEPRADVPAAAGLTPGVDSSVAPSGTPVAPTGAPGPMPSGEATREKPAHRDRTDLCTAGPPPAKAGHRDDKEAAWCIPDMS